jgi:lysozyme
MKRKMRKNLKDQLIKHEGLRLKPYFCTANKLTVGVGRNLDDVGITKEEAMVMLDNDIKRVEESVAARFPWFKDLNEARQDVVLNMVFNLGLGGFAKFKNTIQFLSTGQFEQASIEMLESSWADQVGIRAKELSRIMFNGCYN